MAHECPECGMTCYCNGDIDDVCFDDPEYMMICTCCSDEDDDDMASDFIWSPGDE